MKYYRRVALSAAIINLLFLAQGKTQEAAHSVADAKSLDTSAAFASIREASQAFSDAFNKHDAKAVAEHWTENGDFIDDSGHTYVARAAIEEGYARFFDENPQARLRIVIDSLRQLNDSTVIEDGHSMVDPPPSGAPGIGKYTVVHVKVDGKWLMSTVRDAWISVPSTYNNVADLEWLIGTWTAEEHGVHTESTCRWVANKSFIERSYTVTHSDGTMASGVQLIGWNPQGARVQSWTFSSDGGHAVGVWTSHDGGWSVVAEGTTGDGRPTTAVNRLTRLDDNAYVWQAVQRTLAGQPLPDTDEVVLRRRQAD